MSSNSPLKTFFLQFLKALVAGITVILFSRWMGAEGRGELSLLLYWVNIMMIANEYIGGSNLGNVSARFPLQKIIPFSHLWLVVVSIVTLLFFSFVKGDTPTGLLVLMIGLPLGLLTIQYNLYQGLAMVGQRNTVQLLLEAGKLFLLIGFYLYFVTDGVSGERIELGHSAMIYSLSGILALTISIWFLRKYLPQFFWGSLHPPRELWVNGFWSQNGQLVQFLNYRLALVLISHYLGLGETGVYSNALLMADTIWIFGNSFGTIAHMRMLRSENQAFRADITIRYAAVALVGTTMACVVIAVIPNGVYTGIFGADFAELKSTFLVLIPAVLALGLSTVFSHYLHATNQFKALLLANISGLIMQTGLGVLLIPKWGLYGASLAADAGFILLLMIVLMLFRRQNPHAKLHGVLRFSAAYKVALGLFR